MINYKSAQLSFRVFRFSRNARLQFGLVSRKCAGLVTIILLLFSFLSYSQTTPPTGNKKIEIVNAGSLKFDKKIGNGAKRLIGNVEFKQENTLMFCDSAYFYPDNSLDAFGHVHIQQADSIHLYGDLLKYDGNTKKAVLTKNVIVNKGDMQLTTDALNYDVSTSVGSYTTPAKIINKENTLTSDQGYFFAKSNDLSFKKNVVLTNPQFVINCDTMRYNTTSRVTYFLGPTTIKSKENLIYCEDGWYDTFKDQSRFSKNSYIITKEQKMFGDSLYYDRKKGIGRAIKNVEIIDTTQHMNLKGDYAIHNEILDLSVITGNTLLTQIYQKDTLYMHADTLKAQGEVKPVIMIRDKKTGQLIPDPSVKKEKSDTTNHRKLYAYHKVKFYRSDLQGKCDSLIYTTIDSTMRLFGTPTLWSDENQLTGDSILIVTGKKSLKSIELKGTGFIASQEDSLRFDQVRGKHMMGFFRGDSLYRVNVEGNGQTIYYAKEKNKDTKKEELKAVNRADCSDLHIFFKKSKIDKITFLTKPDATLFPLDKVDINELKLKDFTWRQKDRPLTMTDVFKW